MTKIREVLNCIEKIAPLSLQESYDNAGLIVGDENREVTGVLICLDSTEAIVEEAIRHNCNLIVAHHPIVFSGLKKINGKNYVERTVIKAIQNNIAIYAAHTNLDNVNDGVNNIICAKLGLTNLRILQPMHGKLKKLVTFCPVDFAEKVRQALFDAGCGNIGKYDECSFNLEGTGTFRATEGANPFSGSIGTQHREKEIRIECIFESYSESAILAALRNAHPYEEVAYDIYLLENQHQQIGAGMTGELPESMDETRFIAHVKKTFNCSMIRHTALLGKEVKKVAVCGGSGSFLLNQAIRSGARFFITADFKYHQFFDADNRIVIADVGHYESEQFTQHLFLDLIKKNFSTFAIRLTELNTNPIHYS
jgi:dinuclear metal center YbgI/SA1388 family protein